MRNKRANVISAALVFSIFVISSTCAAETICKPFETRCINSIMEQCNSLGEKWIRIEKCAYGCAGNKCDSGMMLAILWIIGVNAIAFTVAGFIFIHNRRKGTQIQRR